MSFIYEDRYPACEEMGKEDEGGGGKEWLEGGGITFPQSEAGGD